MDEIMKRGNTRKFTDEPVSEEDVDRLIRAGMQARTTGNQTPWHIIIVRSDPSIKVLSHSSMAAGTIRKAPLVLMLLFDKTGLSYPECVETDMGACAQNILTEAEHLGLGTQWVAVHPYEDRIRHVRSFFDLPIDVVPFALIPVGHPADRPVRLDHYDAKRIHKETF